MVSCALLTGVVVWAVPFQFTTALPLKFVPLIVKTNIAWPAVVLVGLSVEIVGMVPAPAGVIEWLYPQARVRQIRATSAALLTSFIRLLLVGRAHGKCRNHWGYKCHDCVNSPSIACQ